MEFGKLVQGQQQQYCQSTWRLCQELLTVERHGETLTKRERDVIKDKYSGFNDELDRIVKTQCGYTIPNKTLREQLAKDNVACIVPVYKAFDRAYRHSGFSIKNPQKYVRHTPEEVQQLVQTLFGAT
jgi:exocyst complex protein 7